MFNFYSLLWNQLLLGEFNFAKIVSHIFHVVSWLLNSFFAFLYISILFIQSEVSSATTSSTYESTIYHQWHWFIIDSHILCNLTKVQGVHLFFWTIFAPRAWFIKCVSCKLLWKALDCANTRMKVSNSQQPAAAPCDYWTEQSKRK